MSETAPSSPRARILIVEDSAVYREMQALLLRQAGYEISAHEDPQAALALAEKEQFDLVLIDYELPQMNGQQFMCALRAMQPEISVIFVSGSLTLDLAIQLSGQGVAGIFNKPANPKTLIEKVNETIARHAARDTAARVGSNNPLGGRGNTNSPLFPAPAAEPQPDQLAFAPRYLPGVSSAFREFTHRMWKVRDFRSVLLLQGEPGSPFEPIGRDLADISIFREGPVMVCPGTQFEARHLIEVLAPSLLSHDAGTLIVTGVENFSNEQQTVLHNLISGRDIFLPFARRFRLILAATGRLSDRVDAGTFDETLYYKISSLSLSVPNLREMGEDVVTLAQHILVGRPGHETDGEPLDFAPDAIEWLESEEWKGNYDQLRGTVLAAANAGKGPISAELLATVKVPATSGSHPPTAMPVRTPAAKPRSTRPPFPISSDLAKEATTAASPASPAVATPAATAATLFARPAAATTKPSAAQSHFRPASPNYDFLRRLEECLAIAERPTAA